MTPQRQRPDGTWTYTSPEWDAKWYWPVGERVMFRQQIGTITKQNTVSAWVQFDNGSLLKISTGALQRLNNS